MRGLSELSGKPHTQLTLCSDSYKCLLVLRLKKKEREGLILVTFNPR